VSNLDPRVTFEHLNDLFTQIGEVKYIRFTTSERGVEYEKLGLGLKPPQPSLTMATEEDEEAAATAAEASYDEDSVGAYVEFSEQPSVVKALCLNGLVFAKRPIRVNHTATGVIVPATADEQIKLDDIKAANAAVKSSSSSKRGDEKSSSSRDKRESSSKKESSRSSRRHRHSKRLINFGSTGNQDKKVGNSNKKKRFGFFWVNENVKLIASCFSSLKWTLIQMADSYDKINSTH
jgi:RNA recognition motif-containing protein